jgi:hypothetical protein
MKKYDATSAKMKRLRVKKSLAILNSGPKSLFRTPSGIEKARIVLYSVSSISVCSYHVR